MPKTKPKAKLTPKLKSLTVTVAVIIALVLVSVFAIWRIQEMSPTNPASDRYLKKSKPFSPGIYYRLPNLKNPQAILTKFDGKLAREIILNPGGFDMRADRVIYPNGNELVLVNSDGAKKAVAVSGLYSISRPSLSPDGKKVVVQASQTADNPPKDLNIYVIDLGTTKYTRISPSADPDESPEWFDRANKIAYSSFSPKDGVSLHIYDLDKKQEIKVIKDAGSLHIALSPDGKYVVSFERHKIFNIESGKQEADLTDNLTARLSQAGYTPDTRFPGSMKSGVFMLDGTFSPDGKYLIMNGAVQKGDQYGEIIYQINNVGEEFKVLVDLVPTNPEFSSGNSFSQENPMWLY